MAREVRSRIQGYFRDNYRWNGSRVDDMIGDMIRHVVKDAVCAELGVTYDDHTRRYRFDREPVSATARATRDAVQAAARAAAQRAVEAGETEILTVTTKTNFARAMKAAVNEEIRRARTSTIRNLVEERAHRYVTAALREHGDEVIDEYLAKAEVEP